MNFTKPANNGGHVASCVSQFLPTVNCSDPSVPGNGSTEAFVNTTEDAEIFFRCSPGFVPAERMRAICTSDGRWNPDPATHVCTGELVCVNNHT